MPIRSPKALIGHACKHAKVLLACSGAERNFCTAPIGVSDACTCMHFHQCDMMNGYRRYALCPIAMAVILALPWIWAKTRNTSATAYDTFTNFMMLLLWGKIRHG